MLGEAMFDKDEIFENIFADINVCPKLGDAMSNKYGIFSLPSFDMQSCYDDSMPLAYDDYIDESGFGRVSIDYDENEVATYDDYCDETYAIKSSDYYIYKYCHDYDYPFS